MKKLLPVILFLLVAGQAIADANDCSVGSFEFNPPVVHAGEWHEVILSGGCASSDVPRRGRVTVEGNTIFIDFHRSGAGLTVPTQFRERVVIGGLPAGRYTILARDPFGPLGNTMYSVMQPFSVKPSFGLVGSEVIIEGVEMVGCPDPNVCLPWGVLFGNVASPRVRITERGEIIAVVPAGTGVVDITVINPRNESVKFERAFTYGRGFEGDYDRVLFPVNFAGRGAFGSDWHTDIYIANDGPIAVETVPLFWSDPDSPVLPPLLPIAPGDKGRFGEFARDGGAFLHVPRGLESRLSYASHIVDRSRTSTDLGTEVPVVRARDTSDEIRLIEVPVGELYRARLRVYDFDPVNGREVLVTIRRVDNKQLLHSRRLVLSGAEQCPNAPCFASRPPFATLDFEQIAELRAAGEIDVTVESTLEDGRIWAFVSVTNNETQDVTLYTPQGDPRRR